LGGILQVLEIHDIKDTYEGMATYPSYKVSQQLMEYTKPQLYVPSFLFGGKAPSFLPLS